MLTAAESLYKVLSEGTKLDRHRLRDAMTVAFDGRTDAQGAWTWKDAYDTSEAAVVLFILEYGNAMSRSSDGEHGPDKALTRFATLEAMEPPETVRSETQVRLQQFSTPLPLAHLAVMAAEIRPPTRSWSRQQEQASWPQWCKSACCVTAEASSS